MNKIKNIWKKIWAIWYNLQNLQVYGISIVDSSCLCLVAQQKRHLGPVYVKDSSDSRETNLVDVGSHVQELEVLSIIRYWGSLKIAGQLLKKTQRSSRCPYTLLLIELPTPVVGCRNCVTWSIFQNLVLDFNMN